MKSGGAASPEMMGYEDLSVVSLSYLGEVLQPRWDPHRNHSRSLREPSVRRAVLRCWNWSDGTRLIHDRRRALVVARVEAHWRGLSGVSVSTLRSWIRGHGVAAGLRHRVGRVVVSVWVTWGETHHRGQRWSFLFLERPKTQTHSKRSNHGEL